MNDETSDHPESFAALCPECEGYGTADLDPTGARDWETGEYLDLDWFDCPVCGGTGWLTTPLTEQDVAA